MAINKRGTINGNISAPAPNAQAIADRIVASIGKGLKQANGAPGAAGEAGGAVNNVTVYQTVNQAGGAPTQQSSGDALVRALEATRSTLDQFNVFAQQMMNRQEDQWQKAGWGSKEPRQSSRQDQADAERRAKAEVKAQTKAAEATTNAMREMTAATRTGHPGVDAMRRNIKNKGVDMTEMGRVLKGLGAPRPDSMNAISAAMRVFNNPKTQQAGRAKAYNDIQDNWKQARVDYKNTASLYKNIQKQQEQIKTANDRAAKLLDNPLLDKNSAEYKKLDSAKGYMDRSASWAKDNPAQNYGMRKGTLRGYEDAIGKADAAVKNAEAAAKKAEAQYKALTSGKNDDRLQSLSGKQQADLANAYKNFQRDRSAANLSTLEREIKSAQDAVGLQARLAKAGGVEMEKRAAKERMNAASQRAGGYDRWSREQQQWFDDASKYQAKLNTALSKGDLAGATENLGLMNKALSNLNPSLTQSEKTINAANKAQEKATNLIDTPMSGSARNALMAASDKLDVAKQGSDMKAIEDATKNLTNVVETAQKSAAAVAERAKATEKQQAALEKNAYTSAQDKADMQARREAWEQSHDTKDLGRYVASVRQAQWGSMSSEMAGLNQQLDMMRNPTGAHDNSADWATAQKQRLDEVTAAVERYNQAVANKDMAGAAGAIQDARDSMGSLKTELAEAEKIQKEIDRVRNSSNYGRLSDSMKQGLADAENALKTSGLDEYQHKVNAVLDTIKQMDSAMANMKTADQWAQASNEVEKYTQKLNRASAGNGGKDHWTEYQSGLYTAASQELANMRAAKDSMDSGAYDAAQKAFTGKLNALNASLMTTRGQMGGMNGQVDALSKTLANFAAPMMMWRRFTGYLRKAASNVAAIDSQMADLRKVTNNTNAEYQQFLTSSGQNAVAIGAKISDLVATTSTFAHMGYSLTDSQALGVTATKFANVGNFQNTTEAADAMIAVIKGFDELNIGDADLVGDKLTAVANNYAVTANDIAQGLQKSASSLNVAGNNIDQSTAMITAIAEVTRDAGAAGSALKVLSMRIRGAKTELSDAGESTEGMAESTSKLRKQVKALTNVDGKGGVDILADEKTFRSTYDIMSDIAGVWQKMSDIDQSALLELLAGKVRSNQVAALLSNFDQADKALKTSQNAEGTMDKVHRAWMDSVEARKAQFEAAQETLSMTAMPANTLKGLYQTGTSALGLLNTVIGGTGTLGFGAGVFGVANALRSGGGNIAAGLGNMFGLHRDTINGGLTRGDLGFVNAYNEAFSQLGDKQAAFAQATAGSNKALDSYTMSLYSSTSGLIDARKVTTGFGTAIKSFAKNALVGIGTFAAMEGAAFIANQAWQFIDSQILHRGETLANNAAMAHAEVEQAQQTAQERKEERKSIQQQISGIEQKGQANGGLTSEEEAELMNLRSQLRIAQYRQEIAEAQAQAKAAKSVEAKTQSYAWDKAQETDIGAALYTIKSGSDARNALLQAAKNAAETLKGMTEGTPEFIQTAKEMQELDKYGSMAYIPATEYANSPEGQALLKLHGASVPAGLAERYQALVDSRTSELEKQFSEADKDLAGIQARSENLAKLFDFINNEKNLSPEALGEAYQFASQEYEHLMESIAATNGRAGAKLGEDENSAYSQLMQKDTAARGTLADRLNDMETGAQGWLSDYFLAGGKISDTQKSAMQDYINSYLGLREVSQPGGKIDAVRSLLAGTPLVEALIELDKLASESKLTAESISGLKVDNVEDAGQKIADVLALFGISLTQAADMWNASSAASKKETDSGGGTTPAKVDVYGDRKTSVAKVFAAQEAGEKQWAASGYTGGMTFEEYDEMMKLDEGAYAAAIEYAHGGLFFNKDVFDQLVRDKYNEELNGLRQEVADTQKKYNEAAQKLVQQAQKKAAGAADFDEKAYKATLDEVNALGGELGGYRAMQVQIANSMGDYANWLRNKSGPESGDMYNELASAAGVLREGRTSGKVGTRQFEAAMRFYTGKDYFDVNQLSTKDWENIYGMSGATASGKADASAKDRTMYRMRKELQKIGILGKNYEVLDPTMTVDEMAEKYNAAYHANMQGEGIIALFNALNETIQNPDKKYKLSAPETPEGRAAAEAAENFMKVAKAWQDGKATAEDLVAASAALETATNNSMLASKDAESAAKAAANLAEDAEKKAQKENDQKQTEALQQIADGVGKMADVIAPQTEGQGEGGGESQGGAQGGGQSEGEGQTEADKQAELELRAASAAALDRQEREEREANDRRARELLDQRLTNAALDAFIDGTAQQEPEEQPVAEVKDTTVSVPITEETVSQLTPEEQKEAQQALAVQEEAIRQEKERQKDEEARKKAEAALADAKTENQEAETDQTDQLGELTETAADTAATQAQSEQLASKRLAQFDSIFSTENQAIAEAASKTDHAAIERAQLRAERAYGAGDWDGFDAAMEALGQALIDAAGRTEARNKQKADDERDKKTQKLEEERAAEEAAEQLELNEAMAAQAAERERAARATATEQAEAALANALQNYGDSAEVTAAYDELSNALKDEAKTSRDISNLTNALNEANDALIQEREQNAAAEAERKEKEEREAREQASMTDAEREELAQQMNLTQEDIAQHQAKTTAQAMTEATEAARAELARMTGLGGDHMAEGAVEAYNALNAALNSETATVEQIHDLTAALSDLNNETENNQRIAEIRQAEAEEAAEQTKTMAALDAQRRQERVDAANALITANADMLDNALTQQGTALYDAYAALQQAIAGGTFKQINEAMAGLQQAMADYQSEMDRQAAEQEQQSQASATATEDTAKEVVADTAVAVQMTADNMSELSATEQELANQALQAQAAANQPEEEPPAAPQVQAPPPVQETQPVQQTGLTEDEIDAIYDRADAVAQDVKEYTSQNLDGNEALMAAGMELANYVAGLGSEISPQELAELTDKTQAMLNEAMGLVETRAGEQGQGEETTRAGGEAGGEPAAGSGDWLYALLSGGRQKNITGSANYTTTGEQYSEYPLWMSPEAVQALQQFESLKDVDVGDTVKARLAAEMLQENLGVAAEVVQSLSSGQLEFLWDTMGDAAADAAAAEQAQVQAQTEGNAWEIGGMNIETETQGMTIDAISNYLNDLFESGAQTVEDLINADRPENGGLGIVTGATYAAAEEQPETPDVVTSASVEPEVPSRQQEVNVETKSATISVPSGALGVSTDMMSQGQSALFSLEDSSYASGLRPNGEALTPAEVQAVNNAISSLEQALTGGDAQALTGAIDTARRIMQGNISTGAQGTETTQQIPGATAGAAAAAQTMPVTVETPEVPTPSVEPIEIPVTVGEADIPTPSVPSVTIPVTYGDPGALSVPTPGTVTIPVAWGDPGAMPTGISMQGIAAASGEEKAVSGTYLVDERGAELIEHVSRGTYELGTDSGARFTKLNAGDIVHTASETKRILGRGGAKSGGGVKTGGTMADGTKTGVTSSGGYGTDKLYNQLISQENVVGKWLDELDNLHQNPTVNTKGVKEFLEWLKKQIDWIPTYLGVLKKKTTAFIEATDDAIHYLSKNQLLDNAISNVSEEIKANMQAALRYQAFLQTMRAKVIDDDMARKVENGVIDITQYKDEDTVKAIQAYQEYWNKLVACRDALKSLNAQMETLSAQKLDSVVSYFSQIEDLLRDQQKTFESLLDMKRQYGQELTVNDYADSMRTVEQILANARNEEAALMQELQEQLGVDGDLVNAILKGGQKVWDVIAEHVKKNTYGIVKDSLPDAMAANDEVMKTVETAAYNTVTKKIFTSGGQVLGRNADGSYTQLNVDRKSVLMPDDEDPTTPSQIKWDKLTAENLRKTGLYTEAEIEEILRAREITGEDSETEAADGLLNIDWTNPDIPVTPITDEEIIALGEELGLAMSDGSEEALANFETIKSLLTTSWEHPLAIGSDTWYEYMSTLENLRESIYSAQTEIGEMQDKIADIPLNNLKTGYDYLDEIRKNLEDINSLLDAQGSDKFTDTFRSLIAVGMKQIENLQEQNKLIEEQMDSLDPLSEKYQELRAELNGNLDTIADIRQNQEEWNDEIIDLQIDRLKKQNDKYKEQLSLMRALYNLENARQRRILVYHEAGGFQYEADEEELEAAQESATDAVYSSIISELERQKGTNNIYGPLGERLIQGSSIVDSLGNILVPVEDRLSGLDFGSYYQSILAGAEQSGLLTSMLNSIDMAKLLESAIGSNDISIDLSGMTLNEVNDVKELCDAIMQQLPNYLLQAMYQRGA